MLQKHNFFVQRCLNCHIPRDKIRAFNPDRSGTFENLSFQPLCSRPDSPLFTAGYSMGAKWGNHSSRRGNHPAQHETMPVVACGRRLPDRQPKRSQAERPPPYSRRRLSTRAKRCPYPDRGDQSSSARTRSWRCCSCGWADNWRKKSNSISANRPLTPCPAARC